MPAGRGGGSSAGRLRAAGLTRALGCPMASGRRGLPGPGLVLLLLLLLLLPGPAGAWYKHVASPRYHTVGRASGLLMGVRRSPYLWRREEAGPELRGGPLPPAPPRWLRSPRQPWQEPPRPDGRQPRDGRAGTAGAFRPPCLPPEAAWAGLALQRALRKQTPPDGQPERFPDSIFKPEM